MLSKVRKTNLSCPCWSDHRRKEVCTNRYTNSGYDFFFDPIRKIPYLKPDGSIKWSEALGAPYDASYCFATSVKQFYGDQPVTVTLATQTDSSAKEVVTAAWDYHDGVLVVQPQEIYKYIHSESGETYWGYYYFDNRISSGDLPASRTGAVAPSMATATATTTGAESPLVTGATNAGKDGDSSNDASASAITSSSTSTGHQGLKLSGMLCASVMGLGLFFSGSGLW